MAFITLSEIIQMVILIFALGYIFSGFIPRPRDDYTVPTNSLFNWQDIKFAAIIASPAVLLHEFGHKFVGIAFGLDATFHIWGVGLGIGIALKLLGSGFLFLAPAYVTVPAGAPPLASALISFAGPAINLALWGISGYVLKTSKNLTHKQAVGWAISKKLNLFLFFFNLIPIPPLDGFNVVNNILRIL